MDSLDAISCSLAYFGKDFLGDLFTATMKAATSTVDANLTVIKPVRRLFCRRHCMKATRGSVDERYRLPINSSKSLKISASIFSVIRANSQIVRVQMICS